MIAPSTTTIVKRDCYPSPILTIPAELLVSILGFLDSRSLLRCCSVCHHFDLVIESYAELQYNIELTLDGMVDGFPGNLSVSERLQILRNRRRAWYSLDWDQHLVVPMPGSCQAYELVGGVFAKTMSTGIGGNGSRHLITSWLPSTINSERVVVRKDIGLPTRDFAIDPSQDLIALVQADDDDDFHFLLPGLLQVHLRTLSTNEPHPQAGSVVLRCAVMFPITNAFIQIVDDVIGMMFWAEPQGPRITLWDWKSGKFLIDRSSLQLPSGTWDFSFLSSRAYMLTCTAGQGSIEIFTFADETRNDSTTASIGALPVHVASLLLPPVLPGVHLMNMHTHTGPFAARCPVGKPFATANHARIHVVSIQYARTGCLRLIDSPRFCLFVHNRTLMSYIHQRKERGGSAVTVPWNKWGPLQTQFMHQREQFQWLRYVQGCRVVLPISYHVAGSTVQVLDFNVCRTKRQIFEEHTASSADSCINTDGTHVGMGNIFQAPVITLMPYRVLSRGELEEYNGVMIDDERLIGLKYPAFSEGDMKDIHVFTF